MRELERMEDPLEWWAENASLSVAYLREQGLSVHGFPPPDTWGFQILLALDKHPRGLSVKSLDRLLVGKRGFSTNGSLRETLNQYKTRGLVERPRYAHYRATPVGTWWIGLCRVLAA